VDRRLLAVLHLADLDLEHFAVHHVLILIQQAGL
jgi:hypothetical protein